MTGVPGEGAAPKLVLASSSPRRRELLGRLGLTPVRVESPDIDETARSGEVPRAYVLRMAMEKAAAIARAPDEVILAGDTMIALGRRILPPPFDVGLQRELLELLSGRRHHCLSAVCVIDSGGKVRTRICDTIVAFKPLSAAEIDAYIESGEGLGKAGGYAIQGRAEGFVRRLSGSYSGVMGLPVYEARGLLIAAGVL